MYKCKILPPNNHKAFYFPFISPYKIHSFQEGNTHKNEPQMYGRGPTPLSMYIYMYILFYITLHILLGRV